MRPLWQEGRDNHIKPSDWARTTPRRQRRMRILNWDQGIPPLRLTHQFSDMLQAIQSAIGATRWLSTPLLLLTAAAVGCAGIALPAGAAPPGSIITFDVPGSTCLPQFFICTYPLAISPDGDVTGLYLDANEGFHSFLRTRDGTFTTVDPPGSGGSTVSGINPEGTIVGEYCDQNGCHGFLRARDGTYAKVDRPGQVFTAGDWGGGGGINPEGTTAGYYYDASSNQH